jgi:hypothetical protein
MALEATGEHRPMKSLAIGAAVVLSLLLAQVAGAETFKCQAGILWDDGAKVVVVASINEDGKTGAIKVAGVTHQAQYRVQGFDRRWDFGLQDDGSFDYAFVLRPDGAAVYFDFSGVDLGESARGSQVFNCR